jgi:hypothetical protein
LHCKVINSIVHIFSIHVKHYSEIVLLFSENVSLWTEKRHCPGYVILFIYFLVCHMGRRSSSEFSTPVAAAVRTGYIDIPLPHGTQTAWLFNVQAVGECEGKNKGQLYQAVEPEIVSATEALPDFPAFLRLAFERARDESCLRLKNE